MNWPTAACLTVAVVAFAEFQRVRDCRRRRRYFAGLDGPAAAPRSERRETRERLARRRSAAVRALGITATVGFATAAFASHLLPGGRSEDWWQGQTVRYFLAGAIGWQAYRIWQMTRDRWAVAAFGPPRFRHAGDGEKNGSKTDDVVPPILSAAAPPPPRDWYDRTGEVLPLVGLGLLFLIFIAGAQTPLEQSNVALFFLFTLLWAAAASLRNWWRMPAPGDLWLTEAGLVRVGEQIAWREVEWAALAPVPDELTDGTPPLAVELRMDDRDERFLVAPEATDALDVLLAESLPPRRILRGEDVAAVPPFDEGLSHASPLPSGG